MNRKWSWNRDGDAGFMLPMIVREAMAKHALTIL